MSLTHIMIHDCTILQNTKATHVILFMIYMSLMPHLRIAVLEYKNSVRRINTSIDIALMRSPDYLMLFFSARSMLHNEKMTIDSCTHGLDSSAPRVSNANMLSIYSIYALFLFSHDQIFLQISENILIDRNSLPSRIDGGIPAEP